MSWASIRRSSIAAILFSLVLGVSLALSQTGTSSIRGTITDPQSRPVAAANVTLTNVATNAKRNMKSTDAGEYVFDLITPGDYRLEVEATGFTKKVLDNVRALIGKTDREQRAAGYRCDERNG